MAPKRQPYAGFDAPHFDEEKTLAYLISRAIKNGQLDKVMSLVGTRFSRVQSEAAVQAVRLWAMDVQDEVAHGGLNRDEVVGAMTDASKRVRAASPEASKDLSGSSSWTMSAPRPRVPR